MTKKKIASFLVVGLSVILLTGCFGGSTETLRCSMEMDLGGFIMETEQVLEVSNSRMQTSEMTITTTFDENGPLSGLLDMDEFLEGYADELESTSSGFGELMDMDGVTFTSDIRGNQYILRITMNFNDVSESQVDSLRSRIARDVFSNWNERISVTETRNELEAQGFTCN